MKISGGINLEFLLENFDYNKADNASRITPLTFGEENIDDSDKQGFVLEGGSGSAKSYDIIQFLLLYCQRNLNKGKDILIFRQTAADCKKTVLKDFIKILRMYDLYDPDKHFMSSPIHFDMFGNTIYFSGLDAIGSHGERHDIIWGNEGMELDFEGFKQLNQRCNEAFFIDYNPYFTEHWVFNSIITRPDTKFFHSTCLQNPFLPQGQRKEILSYEPTPENIKNGTADDTMWKIYGLGLRTAIKGLIFPNVTWIDEMPELNLHYGLDFGFTNDPTCLTIFGLESNNLYAKSLLYEPIDNAPALSDALDNLNIPRHSPITADCSDRYNDTEMVRELKNLGWNIKKVNKGKGIVWRIGLLKKHKIHLVRDVNVKREQENYKWREINGISVNEPVDRYNHCFESNTEILTTDGVKKIIDVKEGDYVLNSFGFNKVLKSFFNGFSEVWLFRLYFTNFVVEIRCTDNHKFKTTTGWKQVNQLQPQDILYLSNDLMANHISYIRANNTSAGGEIDFTEKYGNIIMVKFRKVMKFIIKTKIHKIMILKIWKSLKNTITNHFISKKELKKIRNGRKTFNYWGSKLQKNGTVLMGVLNGTGKMQSNVILDTKLLDKQNALSVEKNFYQKDQDQNFVQENADQKIEENRGLIILNPSVNGAERKPLLINMKKEKDFVQEVVLQKIVAIPIKSMAVYELTVQENHEYFANGLLVHNCWDALGYGYLGAMNNRVSIIW